MEIINPNEIGAKISTLIAESTDKFYAVTAYIELSNWKKILVNLEQAKKRGVSIKFFFREIKETDFKTLTKIGVELYQVKGLHTKLYLNEKEVIVSSMNLYEFSDLHSVDIALHYKDNENYNKLYDYFLKYINQTCNNSVYFSDGYLSELNDLHTYLSERFSTFKITNAKTYLFSGTLIPKFDLFIMPTEINLKYPKKNPEIEIIKELTNKLKGSIKNDFIMNEPDGKYEYYTWTIFLKDQSKLEFVNIITDLQKTN